MPFVIQGTKSQSLCCALSITLKNFKAVKTLLKKIVTCLIILLKIFKTSLKLKRGFQLKHVFFTLALKLFSASI